MTLADELRKAFVCPDCGRWWCAGSNLGFALWVAGAACAIGTAAILVSLITGGKG